MATVKENAALRECPVSQPFAMIVLKLETRAEHTISVRKGGFQWKSPPLDLRGLESLGILCGQVPRVAAHRSTLSIVGERRS